MKFLLDESADARVAPYLRGLGHDVTSVALNYTSGITDEEVLAIATRERRILITFDRDFGELVFRLGHSHAGVLYFRLGRIDLPLELARLDFVLSHYADRLDGFLVVDSKRVKVTPRAG